ncbi:Lrp/AsnC family transcriptional regulator [Priestia sp. YIM B13446]|uniref:Lrp/AsnC family transcriptional regulator n=1 Tax=Priestia TaxID=2800373 RepID=UPI0005C6217F|nr:MULTISPECIES: Lrp/AsnC family transcriptional regulator [Priestia]KWU55668.1 AsnC family transcriptional regulator [Priestia megaterium]MBX9996229.1 Lrp/AsnC family transcriptional regulator [Priestia aryabhattai]MCF8886683.1 Lrp/AsnC family transcriptional regulator [Priestia megaterium]MCP1448056.1 Lrp/AsnC family leucine-responsive transcriptional regulator [Priestia megaterium]MCU7737475.1 Lrp/AsnC family transcriptional regulator [Priestia megaterium]
MKIDEIDLSILQALQQNSRLSLRELGKQINLSPPSVAERVRQLESFGVIKGYTIDIDYEKLHLPVSCFIEVTMKNGEHERFKRFISQYPYALFCERIAGQACFITKLQLPHLHILEQFINEITPYAKTISHIALSHVEMAPALLSHLKDEK